MKRFLIKTCLIAAIFMHPLAATAQGMFDAVVEIDNQVVTKFELDQRMRFLKLLGTGGNLKKRATDDLIADRLKQKLFSRGGVSISDADLQPELEQFAQRANMDAAAFLEFLGSNGIAKETFVDFVRTNVIWREVIRARFGPRAEPSAAEIDRAASTGQAGSNLNVRLAELVIAYDPEQEAEARQILDRVIQNPTRGNFTSTAREYSVTKSRENGGLLPWTSISKLPPPLQGPVRAAKTGDVLGPFDVEGAVILFQLRNLSEGTFKAAKVASLDHVEITLPTPLVAQTLTELDTCDDVYGVAQRNQGTSFEFTTSTPAELSKSKALILSRLDANETFVANLEGAISKIQMLCSRSFDTNTNATVDREAIAQKLRSRRLNSFADGLLSDLRSNARIVVK